VAGFYAAGCISSSRIYGAPLARLTHNHLFAFDDRSIVKAAYISVKM